MEILPAFPARAGMVSLLCASVGVCAEYCSDVGIILETHLFVNYASLRFAKDVP